MKEFIAGGIAMALVIVGLSHISPSYDKDNKVEHIKTGDIDWVCIYNKAYGRSCDVVQQYQ